MAEEPKDAELKDEVIQPAKKKVVKKIVSKEVTQTPIRSTTPDDTDIIQEVTQPAKKKVTPKILKAKQVDLISTDAKPVDIKPVEQVAKKKVGPTKVAAKKVVSKEITQTPSRSTTPDVETIIVPKEVIKSIKKKVTKKTSNVDVKC